VDVDVEYAEAHLALGRALVSLRRFGEAEARLRQALELDRDREEAAGWFEVFEGAGLDGLIAKGLGTPYSPGKRTMLKLKHARTADAVVAGWRAFKQPGPDGQAVVGSLLLGLYDGTGRLQHIGVAASFPMARRVELLDELEPYDAVDDPSHPWAAWAQAQAAGRLPGAVSRWTGGKDLSFVPLRPDLVVEVAYDQMEGDRLRHTARFLRWRPDREAASCTYDQLERPVRYDLDAAILGLTSGPPSSPSLNILRPPAVEVAVLVDAQWRRRGPWRMSATRRWVICSTASRVRSSITGSRLEPGEASARRPRRRGQR
jgi:ATP-dependent DNA ligase